MKQIKQQHKTNTKTIHTNQNQQKYEKRINQIQIKNYKQQIKTNKKNKQRQQ